MSAIGAMAAGTRSPFTADAPDLSKIVPNQRMRTGPNPQGCAQDRRDLVKVTTWERPGNQQEDVDRVARALIDACQLDVVAQLTEANARFVEDAAVHPGQFTGFTPQSHATRRQVRHISWPPVGEWLPA
jgi:hypothetical protein